MDREPSTAISPVPRVLRRASLSPAWRREAQAASRVVVYLAVVAIPIIALLVGPVPPGGGFFWDFARGLGFGGLAMLGVQFALTARFHRLAAPFGIDLVYYFHRWAATGAVCLVSAHYLSIRLCYPQVLGPANPFNTPVNLSAGPIALVLFIVLIATSFARKKLYFSYDRWRIWHGIMAVAAVVLALVHIEGTRNYTRVA